MSVNRRTDWGFLALCVFVFVGCLHGWVQILLNAWAVYEDGIYEPVTLEAIAAAPATRIDGWEPLGSDTQGRDFLKRIASNGDIEHLTIMPDGVGLYARCESPDPWPDVSDCAKIILKPRAP